MGYPTGSTVHELASFMPMKKFDSVIIYDHTIMYSCLKHLQKYINDIRFTFKGEDLYVYYKNRLVEQKVCNYDVIAIYCDHLYVFNQSLKDLLFTSFDEVQDLEPMENKQNGKKS